MHKCAMGPGDDARQRERLCRRGTVLLAGCAGVGGERRGGGAGGSSARTRASGTAGEANRGGHVDVLISANCLVDLGEFVC